MRRVVCYLLVLTWLTLPAWSQPMLPGVPPPGQATPSAEPAAPVGKMYAMRASGAVPQAAHIDEELKAVAPVLESLPFTTYETIAVSEGRELPWGSEILFPINAVYALHTTALAVEEDGAIALRARVEMLREEGYVNALDTMAQAVRDQALLFRGMPLAGDELVIVFLVGMPPEPGEDSPSQEEADPDESDEQDEPEPEPGEEEEERDDADASEPEEATPLEPVEGEEERPEGMDNLEALLDSLEDIDRREQIEERNQRDRIDFRGDWW